MAIQFVVTKNTTFAVSPSSSSQEPPREGMEEQATLVEKWVRTIANRIFAARGEIEEILISGNRIFEFISVDGANRECRAEKDPPALKRGALWILELWLAFLSNSSRSVDPCTIGDGISAEFFSIDRQPLSKRIHSEPPVAVPEEQSAVESYAFVVTREGIRAEHRGLSTRHAPESDVENWTRHVEASVRDLAKEIFQLSRFQGVVEIRISGKNVLESLSVDKKGKRRKNLNKTFMQTPRWALMELLKTVRSNEEAARNSDDPEMLHHKFYGSIGEVNRRSTEEGIELLIRESDKENPTSILSLAKRTATVPEEQRVGSSQENPAVEFYVFVVTREGTQAEHREEFTQYASSSDVKNWTKHVEDSVRELANQLFRLLRFQEVIQIRISGKNVLGLVSVNEAGKRRKSLNSILMQTPRWALTSLLRVFQSTKISASHSDDPKTKRRLYESLAELKKRLRSEDVELSILKSDKEGPTSILSLPQYTRPKKKSKKEISPEELSTSESEEEEETSSKQPRIQLPVSSDPIALEKATPSQKERSDSDPWVSFRLEGETPSKRSRPDPIVLEEVFHSQKESFDLDLRAGFVPEGEETPSKWPRIPSSELPVGSTDFLRSPASPFL